MHIEEYAKQPSKHCYRACETAIKALLQSARDSIGTGYATEQTTDRLAESSCYRADWQSRLAAERTGRVVLLQSMRMRCVQRQR